SRVPMASVVPYYAPPARRGGWLIAVPIALVVIVALGGLFVFAARARSRQGQPLDAANAEMQRLRDQLRADTGDAASGSGSLDPDSPEAKGRRELDRLNKRRGGIGARADSAGRAQR